MLEILLYLFYIGVGMFTAAYVTNKEFKKDSPNTRVFLFVLFTIFWLPFLVGAVICNYVFDKKKKPE